MPCPRCGAIGRHGRRGFISASRICQAISIQFFFFSLSMLCGGRYKRRCEQIDSVQLNDVNELAFGQPARFVCCANRFIDL